MTTNSKSGQRKSVPASDAASAKKTLTPETAPQQQNALQRLLEIQPEILAIGPGKSLREVLVTIADTANSVLGGNFCVVLPYNQASDEFIVEEFTIGGLPKQRNYPWQDPRPDGSSRTALKDGELVIEDYSDPNLILKYPFLKPRVSESGRRGAFQDIAEVKAIMGKRLEASNEHHGVLFINYPKPRNFTDQDKHLTNIFASQAAIAIRNARLYEKEQNARKLAETLREIAAELTQAPNLQATLDLTLGRVKNVVPYDGALFLLLEGGRLIAKSANVQKNKKQVLEFSLGTSEDVVFKKHGNTRSPLSLANVSNEPNWKPVKGMEWARAWLGVRIYTRTEELIGEIGLYSKSENFYTNEHENALAAFASQAALAIENRRYFEQTKKINEIQTAILEQSPDLDRVMQTILLGALEISVANNGQVLLLDENKEKLEISASTSPKDVGRKLDIEKSITGLVIKDNKVISISDVTAPPYARLYEPPEGTVGGSELAVPLSIGKQIIGVLNVESPNKNAFTENHEELLSTLAVFAAAAVQSAKTDVLELRILEKTQESILDRVLSLEETFNLIAKYAKETTNADLGEVWQVKDPETLERVAVVPQPHTETVQKSLPINESVNGEAIKSKSPILLGDTSKDSSYQPNPFGSMSSELVVPLMLRGRPIGTLNVESRKPNAFTRHHLLLLSGLSKQAALAIQTARRQREQQIITEIHQELLDAAFDQKKVLGLILDRSLYLIDAPLGQILLVEAGGLVIRESSQASDVERPVDIDKSVTGLAIKDKRPHNAKDVQTEKPYKDLYQGILGNLHSELVVPLFVGDDVIGAINVESEKIGAFSEDDQRLLEEMALLAALSLRLTEAFAEIGSMQKIQEGILSNELTIEEASSKILDLARKLTGSASGQILLPEGSNMLVIKASTSPEEVNQTRVLIDDSVTGEVFESSKLLNLPDITKHPKYKAFLGGEMRSELAVPLRTGDKTYGVVNVESHKLNEFTKHDEEILSFLAGIAAVAFRTADELEIRKRAEEADKAIAAGQTVHRLTGRAGAIRRWIELIKSDQPELMNTNLTFSTAIKDIEGKSIEILNLVKELQEHTGKFWRMDISHVMHSTIEKLHQTEEFQNFGEGIEITNKLPPSLPTVKADDTLAEVFLNILTNALKEMPDGGRVEITAETDPEWVNIRFKDNGPGIPSAMHETIFNSKFSGRGGGHGLGLWWSRAYAQALGGSLTVESERGKGACFTVKLPIEQ